MKKVQATPRSRQSIAIPALIVCWIQCTGNGHDGAIFTVPVPGVTQAARAEGCAGGLKLPVVALFDFRKGPAKAHR